MAVPGVIPLPAKVDYKRQSLAVPGTKRPGQTAHYRNAIFGQIGVDTPGAYPTLPDVFESGLRLAKDEIFLGHRPLVSKNPLKFADHYVWETYGEADERRRNIGSAIHTLFENGTLGGGEIPTVGLWSQNRPEWVLVDLALNAYKKVGVSLYDTLGDDAVDYVIDHAHITAVVATSNHLSYLLQCAPRHPHLKLIVVMDELTPEVQQLASVWAQAQGVKVQGLRELEEFGKKHRRDVIPASPDDIASICYTSGTTSVPKGVLLTHTNMTMSTFSQLHAYVIGPGQRATMLSYLPLAHIYERASELATMALGGGIGFFTGDPLRLLEDAQILKPHFFPSVPRVLNRIYQAAMIAGGAPGLKGAIFRRAVQAKLDILHQTGSVTHPLWDRLVFNKVRAVLGGNVNLISSGAAPVKGDVIDFLRVALCSEVIEGYGMTENSACCTKTMPGDPTSGGTVGPPQPSMEIKLVDVPTMNYTSEDKPHPRGEVCCRGPAAFKQYYKDEKNTAETVEADGWIHTGDVGEIDDCGRFRIIDRVKNIMKLAQGEYVALEKVENMYSLNPIALQIYVHGNGLKSYLIGVVVADPVQLAALASRVLERKVDEADTATLKALCHEPRIVDAVLASLDGTVGGVLKGFEQLRRIHLTLDPFTVEDNTLTPTLKLRRRDAYAKHKVVLDALYDLPDPAPHSSEPAKL